MPLHERPQWSPLPFPLRSLQPTREPSPDRVRTLTLASIPRNCEKKVAVGLLFTSMVFCHTSPNGLGQALSPVSYSFSPASRHLFKNRSAYSFLSTGAQIQPLRPGERILYTLLPQQNSPHSLGVYRLMQLQAADDTKLDSIHFGFY